MSDNRKTISPIASSLANANPTIAAINAINPVVDVIGKIYIRNKEIKLEKAKTNIAYQQHLTDVAQQDRKEANQRFDNLLNQSQIERDQANQRLDNLTQQTYQRIDNLTQQTYQKIKKLTQQAYEERELLYNKHEKSLEKAQEEKNNIVRNYEEKIERKDEKINHLKDDLAHAASIMSRIEVFLESFENTNKALNQEITKHMEITTFLEEQLYNIEFEKEKIFTVIQKMEEKINKIHYEIISTKAQLDDHQSDFNEVINDILILKTEYKILINNETYDNKIESRKIILRKLYDKIDKKESILLNREREKQITAELLEETKEKLSALEFARKKIILYKNGSYQAIKSLTTVRDNIDIKPKIFSKKSENIIDGNLNLNKQRLLTS
jgi:hypothetical protein